MQRLRTVVRLLPCQLTRDEILAFGGRLVQIIQDIQVAESRETSVRQELKAKLSALDAEKLRLANIIRTEHELRDVQVEVQADPERGQILEVRLDTGEILLERPMNDKEKQLSLVPAGPDPAPDESPF